MKTEISRREKIKQALIKHGSAMTIEQLSEITELSPIHIRQAINFFDNKIVRVGEKTFDLISKVFVGKMFRFTPTQENISGGTLSYYGGINAFLSARRNPETVTLIDQKGNAFFIHHTFPKYGSRRNHFSGLKKLYTSLDVHYGDDVTFTCIDIDIFKFLVQRVTISERNNLQIKIRNRALADYIVNILKYSYAHSEQELFLVEKYLYSYPYFSDPPPDELYRAIADDPRFIFSPRDVISINDGNILTMELIGPTVGLKKYFYKDPSGRYFWVSIQVDDEYGGKYGWCSECWNRMVWEPGSGWRHAKDEFEIEVVPKTFWTYSELKNKLN